MGTTTGQAAARQAEQTNALRPDRMYATYDRFVCGRIDCAGYSAVHTGLDVYGRPVRPVTPEDVADWVVALCMGEMTCEGGHLVALNGLPNADGSARTREVSTR